MFYTKSPYGGDNGLSQAACRAVLGSRVTNDSASPLAEPSALPRVFFCPGGKAIWAGFSERSRTKPGGVIAGATVTVTDVNRGVSRALTTDQAGQYVAPDLLPGTYTIRGEAKGFKTRRQESRTSFPWERGFHSSFLSFRALETVGSNATARILATTR